MATYSALPYDVLHQLCVAADSKTLKDFSLVDKRTRSAAVPILFRSIAFLLQWGDEGVPWERVPENVNELMDNEELISSVRRFVFQPWVADPRSHPIPQQFFNLLRAFRSLTELKLLLQSEYLEQIRNELIGSNAAQTRESDKKLIGDCQMFSSVQSLTVASSAWLELSPLFPNIRNLDINSWDTYTYGPQVVLDYEYLAKMHPNLRRLYSPEQGITIVLQEIARHLPNIEELGLFGGVDDWSGGCILEHLPSYATLSKLYGLALPDESQLGLGYYPPRCGNAYTQPGTRERVKKQKLEAQARLLEGIESVLIRMENGHKKGVLKHLSVGNPKWGYDEHYIVSPDGKLKKATGSDDATL